MKRTLLTLVAVLFAAVATVAAPKKIYVSSAEDFLAALGSNREIILNSEDGFLLTPAIQEMIEAGKLKRFDRSSRAKQTGLLYEEDFDGPQVVLAGFKDLIIRSANDDRQCIEVTPRYVNVLTFVSCENITLTNLYLGHTDEGYCSNGVLGFDDCSNVKITNCGLYGCGTEGIELRQSTNFTMQDSEIFHCSYHIMHLYGSSNCKFLNCTFYNNREFEQVSVDSDCQNVLYDRCVFTKNQGTLFNLYKPENVVLRRCVIQHDGDMGNGHESFENCIVAY